MGLLEMVSKEKSKKNNKLMSLSRGVKRRVFLAFNERLPLHFVGSEDKLDFLEELNFF